MDQLDEAFLRPRRQSQEVQFRVYPSDLQALRQHISKMNSTLKEGSGEYVEEDVFSFMVSHLIGKIKVNDPKKRGRKPKLTESLN